MRSLFLEVDAKGLINLVSKAILSLGHQLADQVRLSRSRWTGNDYNFFAAHLFHSMATQWFPSFYLSKCCFCKPRGLQQENLDSTGLMHRFSVLLFRKSFVSIEIVLRIKFVFCCRGWDAFGCLLSLIESVLFKAPLQFKKIIMFDSLLHPCRPGSECRFKARQPSRFGDGMQPLWVVLWIQLWIHLELLVSEFVWFESRFERLVKAIEPATP